MASNGCPVSFRGVRSFAIILLVGATLLEAAPRRIVAVGGATTETLFALGAGGEIVGVDSTSTFPPEATALPQVGYQRALSAEGIASLKPDLVVLPATAGPETAVEQLERLGIPVLRLQEGHSFEAATARILAIGSAVNRQSEAGALVAKMAGQIALIVPPGDPAPAALFVMSLGSGAPMAAGAGTAADAALRLAGARNLGNSFTGYKQLSREALVALSPEVVVTTSRTMQASNGNSPQWLPGLELTPAGKNSRVVVMDDLFLLGFGPRSGEAIRELARRLGESRLRAGS